MNSTVFRWKQFVFSTVTIDHYRCLQRFQRKWLMGPFAGWQVTVHILSRLRKIRCLRAPCTNVWYDYDNASCGLGASVIDGNARVISNLLTKVRWKCRGALVRLFVFRLCARNSTIAAAKRGPAETAWSPSPRILTDKDKITFRFSW